MHRPLSKQDLLPDGPLGRLGREVYCFDRIESTNAFLLARAAELPDGTVAAAEFQSAGRGRRGRKWESPRGASVLLSVLLIEPADSWLTGAGREGGDGGPVPQAGMLAALAACEAIEACTDCKPAQRWPNDLVLAGRKLGGVLAQSRPLPASADGTGPRRAVVLGIGINCLQQRGHFAAELAQRATSLEIESARPIDRAAIAAQLLARLDAQIVECSRRATGWASLRARWLARCEDLGSRVTLRHDARSYRGTILDVTDDGDLLVQLDQGGRRRFASATTTRVW